LSIQLAVEMAIEHGVDRLLILNDSQTPVRHVNGEYAIKAEHLRPIVERTWELGRRLDKVRIEWTRRENTLRADELCREVDSEPDEPPEWLWKNL
jgi:ribonuclease HI